MNKARLNVAVWSASLWVFGWTMHEDMLRTGRVDPAAIIIAVIVWLYLNSEAGNV